MVGRSFAIINGKRIELPPHSSISIVGTKIMLDGKEYNPERESTEPVLSITIEGNVESIKVDRGDVNVNGNVGGHINAGGTVGCGDVAGTVESGGSVTCRDVTGYVDAGGSVTCHNIQGDVEAGGSVKCDDIGGSVDAGGSIKCKSHA